MVGRLREALHTQVRVITDMFVYADAGKVPVQVRNELSSLGFDCIDCSHAAGKTGQVDIRIVARALKPGLSGEQRPSTVLVTGDGDFAYTLSTLRNAGVGTILVYNSDRMESVNTLLLEASEVVLPVSFGGSPGAADGDEAAPAPTEEAQGGAPTCASASEAAFFQALDRAPIVEDGWKLSSQVGVVYLKIKPHGGLRYRDLRLALCGDGRVERGSGDRLRRPRAP